MLKCLLRAPSLCYEDAMDVLIRYHPVNLQCMLSQTITIMTKQNTLLSCTFPIQYYQLLLTDLLCIKWECCVSFKFNTLH